MTDQWQDASPNYATLAPPKTAVRLRLLLRTRGPTRTNTRYAHGVGRKGWLILRLPPRDAYYELSHWDGDTFTCYFASESTGLSRRGAEFSPGKNQVLIEILAPEHDAVFTRAKAAQ